jgi:hypothetical protein
MVLFGCGQVRLSPPVVLDLLALFFPLSKKSDIRVGKRFFVMHQTIVSTFENQATNEETVVHSEKPDREAAKVSSTDLAACDQFSGF